jgi:hypothetical protein
VHLKHLKHFSEEKRRRKKKLFLFRVQKKKKKISVCKSFNLTYISQDKNNSESQISGLENTTK